MEFDEFVKDIKEDELPPEEDSKLKKVILLIGGILLILLMFSYVFASYPVSNIIAGWLESEPLQDNVIELENFSIVFEDGTHEQLKDIYFAEQKVEFSVCLQGKIRYKDYHITSLYKPKTYQQAFNYVVSDPCSKATLIMLHSHPYKSCLASATDLSTLKRAQMRNPGMLMVVMCEPERFSVYR